MPYNVIIKDAVVAKAHAKVYCRCLSNILLLHPTGDPADVKNTFKLKLLHPESHFFMVSFQLEGID